MPKIKNIKKKHQSINPDVAVIYKTHGDYLLHLGKIQESIDYFNKAILYNPYYIEAYNEKAYALVLQDKYQESLITINKAIITKPYYYELYINKSILLYILGMVDEASIALNKGLQKKTCYFHNAGLKTLGKYLFLKGEFEKANNIFENILKTQQDDTETLYELSQTFLCINTDQQEANKYHNQAINIKLNQYIKDCFNPEQTEPIDLTTHNKSGDIEMTGENCSTHFDQDGH